MFIRVLIIRYHFYKQVWTLVSSAMMTMIDLESNPKLVFREKPERHQDVVRVSNTRGRENWETSETVTLMVAQF